MSFFGCFGHLEPKSPLHNCLYQIAVIAFAEVDLKSSLVLGKLQLSIYLVGVVDQEEKFFEFVDFGIY